MTTIFTQPSMTHPWTAALFNTCIFVGSVTVSRTILRVCDFSYIKLFKSKNAPPPSSNVRFFAILLSSSVIAFGSSYLPLHHSSGFLNHPLVKKTALVYFGSILMLQLLAFGNLIKSSSLSSLINRVGVGVTWTISSALWTRAIKVIAKALDKRIPVTLDNTVCKVLLCFMNVLWAHMEIKKEEKK